MNFLIWSTNSSESGLFSIWSQQLVKCSRLQLLIEHWLLFVPSQQRKCIYTKHTLKHHQNQWDISNYTSGWKIAKYLKLNFADSFSHFSNLKCHSYMCSHIRLVVWFPLMPQHIKTRSFILTLEAKHHPQSSDTLVFHCLAKHSYFIPVFLRRHFIRIIALHCHLHEAFKMPTSNVTSKR